MVEVWSVLLASTPSVPKFSVDALLIVTPTQKTVAASLLARRLAVWGARSCVVANAADALARLADQEWDAVMVDRAIGPQATEAIARAATRASPRRIVLVTPGDRGELPNLKDAGFTGYLVKPVRAASLAAIHTRTARRTEANRCRPRFSTSSPA